MHLHGCSALAQSCHSHASLCNFQLQASDAMSDLTDLQALAEHLSLPPLRCHVSQQHKSSHTMTV
eukprot:2681442-Amphidinium_carterae.1